MFPVGALYYSRNYVLSRFHIPSIQYWSLTCYHSVDFWACSYVLTLLSSIMNFNNPLEAGFTLTPYILLLMKMFQEC